MSASPQQDTSPLIAPQLKSPGQTFLEQLQQRIPDATHTLPLTGRGGGGGEFLHNVTSPMGEDGVQHTFILPSGSREAAREASPASGGEFNNNQQAAAHMLSHDSDSSNRKTAPSNHRHKLAPKDWDAQFADNCAVKSVPLAYAFVNHNYQDRVISRLLQKQASEPAGKTDALPTWLLPRSVSAYEQVSTNDYDSEDSTSTDTELESSSDIWQQQRKKRSKAKKETSV